ncbi:MAG: ExeM/NucH family extracellular endonuclease [Chloroflexota bacterium]
MSRSTLFLLVALALMLVALGGISEQTFAQAPDVYLNEIQVSTEGDDDWEFFEIQGAPDTDLSSLTLVGVESDAGATSAGMIDVVIDLTDETIPDDGFWVAMSPAAETAYGVSGDMDIADNGFENSSATYFLVADFSGSAEDDLDTDDDGELDVTPWSEVVDSVSVLDDEGDFDYGAPSVGPDGDFLPSGTYRCPDAPDGDFDSNMHSFSTPDGTPGEANDCPEEIPIGACGDPATFIHEVQGSGDTSPLVGNTVNIEGVVVGDFQAGDGDEFGTDLGGFFVQEEAEDMDELDETSEGIFVYAPGADDVEQGDIVRLQGEVEEFETGGGVSSMTQLAAVGDVLFCEEGTAPEPVEVTLPVASFAELEQHEGMLVTFPQELVIAEYFNYDRFNEIVLAEPNAAGRMYQPTAFIDPADTAAIEAELELIARSRVTLDDARETQNPPLLRHPNGEPFDLDNIFRGGDVVEDATGALAESFGVYRIQPTAPATYTQTNPRPEAPDAGGKLEVSAYNVLNYFLTIDDGSDNCGPDMDLECRGADTEEEFERQRAKILAALLEMESDVFGLIEMENTTGVEPLADIVDGLNDALGEGAYDYIATGTTGSDAIKNGIIYKTSTVTPVGDYAVLDDPAFVNPRDADSDRNRPAVAQTFVFDATGEQFTVVVNHLKSKGSPCGEDDDDPYQGNCNLTRTLAADYLVKWLDTDPTGESNGNHLIIGDLNAYDKEDPIAEIAAGPDDMPGTADDYVDLLYQYQGEFAYTYVFDGQLGYLDYAMANQQLLSRVASADVWHANTDESDVLDYDMTFKPEEQEALYEPNPYRASDHDPVIVGLFPDYERIFPLIFKEAGRP